MTAFLKRMTPFFLLATTLLHGSNASNPYSSNVVALTSKNWREEVEESPHAVFVNICRSG